MNTKIKDQLLVPQPNYAAAKVHAQYVDDIAGYRCSEIEESLSKNQHDSSSTRNFWFGLDIQSLQTPYSEIVEMINFIEPKPGDTWVDLGAGYGRMGVTLGFIKPGVHFIGYEYVQARVDEGNRILKFLGLTQAELNFADVSADTFQLPRAEIFFLYDFGSREDIFKIFEKLKIQASKRPVRVVARGRGVRNWIMLECPWLCEVNSPIHFAHWSVFQS